MDEQEYWSLRFNDEYHSRRINEQSLLADQTRPCILLKPKITLDGNKYCVLYGNNLMEGISGWGESPHKAMIDFDRVYYKDKEPQTSK